uniref:Uncharacterized protein n=1 Tax=Anopheles melas TaxID=34690 RepID=A0A182TKW3_9DIPT
MMNDPAALGMIPFDTIGLYEQPKPRFIFKMPRVVPDQKSKFESDDLFKKLSRDSEVNETWQVIRLPNKGLARLRQPLMIKRLTMVSATIWVHIKSHFIMNGVCVRFRGWLDMERLDGIGCLEMDEKRAAQEDAILREQLERYNQRLRDFEDKQRTYQRTTQDEFEQMRRNGSGMGVGVTAGSSGMWRR